MPGGHDLRAWVQMGALSWGVAVRKGLPAPFTSDPETWRLTQQKLFFSPWPLVLCGSAEEFYSA